MKTFELSGIGVDSLVFAERPMPPVGPHDLLLRIRAASLNYRDLAIARGEYGKVSLPLVLGSDAVGEVIEAGAEAKRFAAGDRSSPPTPRTGLPVRPTSGAAREAFAYLASGAQFGKIVIRV